MKTAKGRYPLSKNAGSARAWAPKHITLPDPQDPTQTIESAGAHVPRPDRSLTTLRFISVLGILGLDHFYLRSPKTGLAKLLTLGGFGFWWFWDIAQTLFEGDRVVKYGMNAPFDLQQGIGQGMITDQGTRYTQRSSYMLWILAVMFGFLGLDMLMLGHVGQFVRKLIMGSLTMACLGPRIKPYSDWGFGDYFWGLIGLMFGGGLILSYFMTFNRVFNEPEKMLDGGKDGGIPLTSQVDQLMNWNKAFVPPDDDLVEQHWVFHSIPANILSNKFWIEHETDPSAPEPPSEGNSWWAAGMANYGYMIKWVIEKIVGFFMALITDGASAEVGGVSSAAGDAEEVASVGKKAGMLGKLTGKLDKTGFGSKLKHIAGKVPLPGSLRTLAKHAGIPSSLEEVEAAAMQKAKAAAKEKLQSALQPLSPPPSPPPSPTFGPQASPNQPPPLQVGGAKLSTESVVLGGTVFALIAGGAVKAVIDYVMPE